MNTKFTVSFTRAEVDEFFGFMDRDYDGNLSFEEFMGEESTIERLFKAMDKVKPPFDFQCPGRITIFKTFLKSY